MESLKFVIDVTDAGTRIDKYITQKLGAEYSRTYVKFLIDGGFVQVNGSKIKPHHTTRFGEEIFVELAPHGGDNNKIEPENIPLKILYEDDWIIVVDKPAGMVVHPAGGVWHGTLVNALLYHTGALPESDETERPGIVHRLDKDTSGVMVVAKNSRAMRSLAKQFQNRAIKKRYIAIVNGRVEMDNGIIEAPLARHETDRKKMSICYTDGKEAKTAYHVIKRFKKHTLLSLDLFTGRTHQIRVHMKHIGYSILGDSKYGVTGGMARQALHAEMIGFTHPDTSEYMEFVSPIPEDMKEFIERLKKDGLENKTS